MPWCRKTKRKGSKGVKCEKTQSASKCFPSIIHVCFTDPVAGAILLTPSSLIHSFIEIKEGFQKIMATYPLLVDKG